MQLISNALRATVVGATLTVLTLSGAVAQEEPSETHVSAARDAIDAIGATKQFDNILLGAALNLKSQLIQTNPDLETTISATVDEVALDLAGRRGDLENEAARVYATYFTEEELRSIADFYSTTAGEKLLANGPAATRDLLRAADIWGRGVGRDLAQAVGTALQERVGPGTEVELPDATPAAPQTQ